MAQRIRIRHRRRDRWRPLVSAIVAVTLGVGALAGSPDSSAGAESSTTNRFLLTAATASMGISVLRVSDGARLSPVPGSPFRTGFGVLSLEVSPDGSTVYVPHIAEPAVSGYHLDASGRLTPIPGAYVRFAGLPTAARLSPDGKHLFVVVGGVPGRVESFAVSSSGALTPTGTPPVAVDGLSLVGQAAVDPDGRFLRVVTYLGNTLSSFAIGANGRLTPHGVTPIGLGPVAPAFTPDGKFLYTSDEITVSVSGFRVAADGDLVRTPGSPYLTGGLPHGAIATPDGTRLYVPNAIGPVITSIAGFHINADGGLTPLPNSPYLLPIGALPGSLALDPDGKHLYAVDVATVRALSSQVHTYTINANGSLSPANRPAVDTGALITDGPVVALTTVSE